MIDNQEKVISRLHFHYFKSIPAKTVVIDITLDEYLNSLDRFELFTILFRLHARDCIKIISPDFESFDVNNNTYEIEIFTTLIDKYNYTVKRKRQDWRTFNWVNFLRVFDVVLDIYDVVELEDTNKVKIKLLPNKLKFIELFPTDNENTKIEYIDNREKSLKYLWRLGFVTWIGKAVKDYSSGFSVDIEVDIDDLKELAKLMKSYYLESLRLKNGEERVAFQVEYSSLRHVLLNGTVIGKPDFDSENDLVMKFLFEHPNQKFTKKQIEEDCLGQPMKKSFHKIIENLGFKGDIKKLFFSSSTNAIEFRNPITFETLDKLGVDTKKLVF